MEMDFMGVFIFVDVEVYGLFWGYGYGVIV